MCRVHWKLSLEEKLAIQQGRIYVVASGATPPSGGGGITRLEALQFQTTASRYICIA